MANVGTFIGLQQMVSYNWEATVMHLKYFTYSYIYIYIIVGLLWTLKNVLTESTLSSHPRGQAKSYTSDFEGNSLAYKLDSTSLYKLISKMLIFGDPIPISIVLV